MTSTPVQSFEFRTHVPYADIDKMGIVYYANYFVYFEMARAKLLRDVGLPYMELEDRGVMLPVVAAHCDYRTSAHYDDELVIRTTVAGWQGARLHMEYEVVRGDDLIATGHTDHVCMGSDGRVTRPDAELQAAFAATSAQDV